MPATFIERDAAGAAGPDAALAPAPAASLDGFLGELLAAQQRLQTPVVRVAEAHPHPGAGAASSVHAELLPLSAPAPGEQYAFEVDLDACSGCKACVAACHALNGLDETETWRDVGLVIGGDAGNPFQQTITSACHHCAEPACAHGCPVLAYEKDPVTGIVRHLDDQCIGCSYCTLTCPYDVPKFNARLGIVRKCDMCHGRLAAGEAPACAQACPTHAIRIVVVSRSPNAEESAREVSAFLPVAPDPRHTRPTTRYVTRRPFPQDARAADAGRPHPQAPHWALTFLLVFTQAGYGILAANLLGEIVGRSATIAPGCGLALVGAGLLASVAHLGRPARAWRVFLGLRRSWLSRESVAFALSAVLLVVHAMPAPVLEKLDRAIPGFAPWSDAIFALGVACGLAGIACSVMIYAATPRRAWRWPRTTLRFGGTVAVATAAALWPAAAAGLLAGKLAGEAGGLVGRTSSARLQRERLRGTLFLRWTLGAGAVALFLAGPWSLALAVWLLGELAERSLYFRAVDAAKMPGWGAP